VSGADDPQQGPDGPDDVYTHGHHEAVLRSHRWRTADNSAAYLLSHLRPGLALLDIGCGPGTLTVDLAGRVAPGRVLGVDVASDAVDAARTYAASEGAASGDAQVSFAVGDFRAIGLAPASFDVVHAHQVLQHLRSPTEALVAMAALARPDGGIVAARDADYEAMTWAPADERLDRWAALYQAVTSRNGADANAGRHLKAWARSAGLQDVTYTTSTWTFSTPEDRSWWSETWAERVVSSSLATQAQDYGLATAAELADIAAGWRAWAEDEDAVFTVVHGEIVARV
jgi:2-polyprenyl-3-methyl-5-hydroxy-6-metoxy-1,4-benzoquinol methylase